MTDFMVSDLLLPFVNDLEFLFSLYFPTSLEVVDDLLLSTCGYGDTYNLVLQWPLSVVEQVKFHDLRDVILEGGSQLDFYEVTPVGPVKVG